MKMWMAIAAAAATAVGVFVYVQHSIEGQSGNAAPQAAASVRRYNCGQFNSAAMRDVATDSDVENRIVHVRFFVNDTEASVDLPFEPEADFPGCSQSAKALLRRVLKEHEEYTQQLCDD